jgi:hypothetical protein
MEPSIIDSEDGTIPKSKFFSEDDNKKKRKNKGR